MSFGNSYTGGRTRMKTKVFLNVYDLSPANDFLFPIGLGFHHCGLEIDSKEYSFGSGGSGIFEGPPRLAPGARFRSQLELGCFDGGTKELNQALDDLRSGGDTGGFGPNTYNLVKRNCNHFCNALSWRLLRKQAPAYINRWADIGNCCSCLLPKKLLEGAPVGGDGENGKSNQSFALPTRASMNRGDEGGTRTSASAFEGKGHSLGGPTTLSGESQGLLSSWAGSSSKSSTRSTPNDDLTDRREKARKAALARLERSQPAPGQDKQS